MSSEMDRSLTRLASWLLRRNPFYLVSAVAMAIGARLLLVGPDDIAGDLQLIVLTLVVLQVYEWMVSSILLLLDRSGRSPEDKPSLLLVAAAFWTGPLAATIEMTVMRPELGTCVAIGVGVIAVAELAGLCRLLELGINHWAQAAGIALLGLIVATPSLLRLTTTVAEMRELVLYAAWCLLAAIALMPMRLGARHKGSTDHAGGWVELAFLSITLGAAMLHLWAMNYSFFCHARLFYVSPLLVALAVVGLHHAPRIPTSYDWLLVLCAFLPGAAIILTIQPFHPAFPLDALPWWARDPMASIAAMAAAAWYFGFVQCRHMALLHAGSAAACLCAFRASRALKATGYGPPPLHPAEIPYAWLWAALYVLTGYLLVIAWWRRSRLMAALALLLHLGGFTVLIWNRSDVDGFAISVLSGWTVLILLHLSSTRISVWIRLLPITWLAAVSWYYDADPTLAWFARGHAAISIGVLALAGYMWPWTHYRRMAIAVATAHAAHYAVRCVAAASQPPAFFVVTGAFLLLVLGALISWNKRSILRIIDRQNQ